MPYLPVDHDKIARHLARPHQSLAEELEAMERRVQFREELWKEVLEPERTAAYNRLRDRKLREGVIHELEIPTMFATEDNQEEHNG